MHHLAQSVDAGIRAPGGGGTHPLARKRLDGAFQRGLHGRPVVLRLPADERAAVIFDGQFIALHGPVSAQNPSTPMRHAREGGHPAGGKVW